MSALPIAIDETDALSPPRVNGELTFEAPWQGRAFGVCVALLDRYGLTWDDFRPHLVAAIDAQPEAPYFDCFAVALEEFAADLTDR